MLFLRNLFRKSTVRRVDGRYGALKVALIADELTTASLSVECQIRNLTPQNAVEVLRTWRPDLLFVESAWHGYRNAWKYQLASYDGFPNRNNRNLKKTLDAAAALQIPSVFWNKEDGVHYARFIDTASLFENVFTVDEGCLERYKLDLPSYNHVGTLMFSVQPRFHYLLDGKPTQRGFGCFVGSYGTHVHARRRYWQNMLFEMVAPYGLHIYDRNYRRKAQCYRYPVMPGLKVYRGVPHPETAQVYRSYRVNLNVNTVENSSTMYSRRLAEILAVGAVAVTTPSLAAHQLFSDYCFIVNTPEELAAVLEEVKGSGYSKAQERAHHGADMIARHHTWEQRLAQIECLGLF